MNNPILRLLTAGIVYVFIGIALVLAYLFPPSEDFTP